MCLCVPTIHKTFLSLFVRPCARLRKNKTFKMTLTLQYNGCHSSVICYEGKLKRELCAQAGRQRKQQVQGRRSQTVASTTPRMQGKAIITASTVELPDKNLKPVRHAWLFSLFLKLVLTWVSKLKMVSTPFLFHIRL